ncbi:MAG: ROK family protein [Candidatus Aenigmarchaeota archaeon]|nr:ROK family protein [Candidatus Aenigmarchaeota archaeon]
MVSKMYIAIDLGATNLRVGIGQNKILEKVSEPTAKKSSRVITQVVRLSEYLLKKYKTSPSAVGIASIGPFNLEEGSIIPPNLPFKKLKLVKPLEKKFKTHVHLINDCHAAVLAEKYFGAGKSVNNLVYVTLSTGIGGGAIVDGNLLLGKDGNAVHIGHTIIDFERRLRCGCGNYGCWEAYCSGANIPNFIRFLSKKIRVENSLLFKLSKGLNELTSELLFECAKKDDKISMRIVDEIGRLNAIGFANMINLFDPELITVGGSIALNNPRLVLQPIKKYVRKYAINKIPEIRITPLGEDTGLLGALIVAKKFH